MNDSPIESPFADADRLRHEMRVMQNDLHDIREQMIMFNSALGLLLRLETQRQDEKSKNVHKLTK